MAENDKNPLVCCRLCGRDTRAASEVCGRCYGRSTFGYQDEQRGRKTSGVNFSASPVDDSEDVMPLASEMYHGATVRDDL